MRYDEDMLKEVLQNINIVVDTGCHIYWSEEEGLIQEQPLTKRSLKHYSRAKKLSEELIILLKYISLFEDDNLYETDFHKRITEEKAIRR